MSISSGARPDWMPVNVPYPSVGVTVATLDKAGNLTIKVDQPLEVLPPPPNRIDLDNLLRLIGDGKKIDAVKQYRAMVCAPLKDALRAIELAMPRKPERDVPEDIAVRILDTWHDGRKDKDDLIRAIAAAIRAERG